MHSQSREVAHAVDFWFPATEQLHLSLADSCCRLEGRFPRSDYAHSAVVPPALPFFGLPPVLTVPRSKAKAKPRGLAVGPKPSEPAQPRVGPAAASAAAAASTDPDVLPAVDHPLLQGKNPSPFTSFDEMLGTRVLAGEADWPGFLYMQHAVETASLPGDPTPRMLVSELVGYPSPQVALTQDRGPDLRRAVVVEATTIGGTVETLDAFPGVNMIGILRGLRSILYPRALEEQVQAGTLLCLVNKALVDPYAPLPPDTDVIHFMLARPAVASVATGSDDSRPTEVRAVNDDTCEVVAARHYGPRPEPPPVPMPVHRPATPPVPPASASSRLVERCLPGAPGVRPFTTFDAHYGHRTFYCHGFATYPDRVRIAVQASPALGLSPRFEWLDREVEGLPVPQLVLQQAHVAPGLWTFPFDLRSFGGHVCVLIADRQSSALEFIARATDVCRLHGRVYPLLLEGSLALEVDGHPVAADAQQVLKFASITKLQRTRLWGRHQIFRRHGTNAGVMLEHRSPSCGCSDDDDAICHGQDGAGRGRGIASDVPAFYEFDADRFPPMQDCSILVHVVGLPAFELVVPYTASEEDICQLAKDAVIDLLPEVAHSRCRWRPCFTSPVGEHLFHSVLVVGSPEEQDECQIVLDLRAANVPSLSYHTAVFPVTLSTELLFRLVTNFLGGHRPCVIFQGLVQVDGYMCTLSTGQMLRPVLSSTATGLRIVQPPALWRTAQCVQATPGLRLAFTNALANTLDAQSYAGQLQPVSTVVCVRASDDTTITTTRALTTSTTTTCAPSPCTAQIHPFVGLHQLDYVVHLVGQDACTAHTVQCGRGHLAEILNGAYVVSTTTWSHACRMYPYGLSSSLL